MRHLIFYDDTCPLCKRAVHFILKRDKKKSFGFAPLKGKTAENYMLPSIDSLILVQEGKKPPYLIEGKGALRILWLLGGPYKLVGIFSFLPSKPFDFFYRIIAKRRHLLFKTSEPIDFNRFRDRFFS